MNWDIPGLGQVETLRTEVNRTKGGIEHICLCPNSDCNKPKFSINEDTLIYRCWVCGLTGRIPNQKPTTKGRKRKTKPLPKVTDIEPKVIHEYIQILVDSLDHGAPQVKSYFNEKKINAEFAIAKFKVGYSSGRPKYPDMKIAETLGLMKRVTG